MTAKGKSSQNTSALFDIEIYSPSGRKVYQKFYDNQSFTAGIVRSFGTSWTIPASAEKGIYTVKIGVFKPGWSGLLSWNDRAAQFTVR